VFEKEARRKRALRAPLQLVVLMFLPEIKLHWPLPLRETHHGVGFLCK
jgi:hypothetical protein